MNVSIELRSNLKCMINYLEKKEQHRYTQRMALVRSQPFCLLHLSDFYYNPITSTHNRSLSFMIHEVVNTSNKASYHIKQATKHYREVRINCTVWIQHTYYVSISKVTN